VLLRGAVAPANPFDNAAGEKNRRPDADKLTIVNGDVKYRANDF
jgi:hypothetical protein